MRGFRKRHGRGFALGLLFNDDPVPLEKEFPFGCFPEGRKDFRYARWEIQRDDAPARSSARLDFQIASYKNKLLKRPREQVVEPVVERDAGGVAGLMCLTVF
jgi:hypothetical protein